MRAGVYLYRVSNEAAVQLLSDSFVQVPHVVECVEEGGHVENLTEQKQFRETYCVELLRATVPCIYLLNNNSHLHSFLSGQ